MFKPLACIVLSSFFLTAAVADTGLSGVWEGVLDGKQIRLCFNSSEPATAGWYELDLATVQALGLVRDAGVWSEPENKARWMFKVAESGVLNAARTASVDGHEQRLRLLRQSGSSSADNCASEAFRKPVETALSNTRLSRRDVAGYPYERRERYGQEVMVLVGEGDVIAKVNADLSRLASYPGQAQTFYEQLRQSLLNYAKVEVDERVVSPYYRSENWVTFRFYQWAAGTGRNGISWGFHTWDLSSAEEVDPWSWFGAKFQWHDAYSGSVQLPDKLRLWLASQVEVAEGCSALAENDSYSLTFDRQGIRLTTPAYGDGCELDRSFTWAQVQPLLAEPGRKALARLRH